MPAIAVLQFGMMTVSAMHWLSGRLPAGWFARGGTAYSSTAICASETPTAGDELLSDDVLLIVHCRIESLTPSSVKTARELRKYSLPPLAVAKVVPGTVAGQTVKPAPSGPAPSVLNSTALPVPPRSRFFEMPYICEP